jgi:hypothetical protein
LYSKKPWIENSATPIIVSLLQFNGLIKDNCQCPSQRESASKKRSSESGVELSSVPAGKAGIAFQIRSQVLLSAPFSN